MIEASIEELLRHEDDPPARGRDDFGLRWWTRNLLAAAVLTVLTVAVVRMYGVGLPVVVVLATVLALLLLRRVTVQVAPPADAHIAPGDLRAPAADDIAYRFAELDGVRRGVNAWERRLHWTGNQPGRFVRAVQPLLAELVDERLRQRHGITRATDPARARALLGEPLWSLLSGPIRRTPTRHEYAAMLARLEDL